MFTARELEAALISKVGETEEDDGWEWYETVTGLNGFYHLLAGTGRDSTNMVGLEKTGNVVNVPGLGEFTFVEATEDNFDTYEKSWDNHLVFQFNGKTYRVHGRLDSHDGGIWDGRLQEVEPVEKVITVWRTV